ncbi:phage tail protein [Pseudomonas sp. BF-B-26]|uniref:phage tail protein n=1 Tax=Pseudomonas sp. BF-B-26 TaxID=2832400 RepID=UPI001CBC2053|nr:phage tail protein [Pseudomonas sp. BF-B-26]
MVDKNTIFGGMLTLLGAAKKTNCDALGIPWEPRFMLIGDANGTDPVPDPSQTKLVNQVYRAQLNQLYVSPTDDKVLVAELVLPPDIGGWWVRELALEDKDGVFSAVSNVAPSYKPQLAQNSGRNQVVRMHIITSSTANIQLKIDPSVVLATREYVDTKILEELYKLDNKQSVRVATTANIALAGLQVLDGVTLLAGDRVLVKNQTVAKDNGIYIAGAPAWVRAPDADTNTEVTSALLVSVEQGTTLADTRWQLVTDGVIVLGATALTFQNITQGFAPINSPAFLGAPTALTPPQFDSSLRLVNTAFAKRMGVEYSGFAPLTASTALGASSIGGIVAGASATPINITLPPTAGVPEGASVEVVSAGSGAVTVLAAGLDVLASQVAGVIPVVLGMGDSAKFVKVSSTWRLRGGSMALKYAAVMSGQNWITQPQFDSSKAFATTEFAKRMGVEWSSFNSVNVSTVLAANSVGGVVSVASATATNLTLPPTAPVSHGSTILVLSAGNGATTLLGSGADLLTNAFGSTVPVVLGIGDSALLTKVTGEWRLIGGSVALKHANMLSQAIGTTQPQFANDKSFATTEFVQRALGSRSGRTTYGATTVLTVADIGKLVMLNYSGSVTLPAVAGLPAGAALELFNWGASPITVNASAGTVMNAGLGGLASFVLLPGTNAYLTLENAASWVAKGGDGLLSYSPLFAASLGANGYQKLPSGKMEMWGTSGSIPSGGSLDITLPSTFPIEALEAFATPVGGGNITTSISWAVSLIGPSTIRIYHFHGGGGAANYRFHAIGR